jgi:hypothetical protein
MLGHEDYIADARGLQYPHPLIRIELRRIEYFWVGRAISPFAIHEGVGTEMDDRSHLQVLPIQLLWGWFQINFILGDGRTERDESEEQRLQDTRTSHGKKTSIFAHSNKLGTTVRMR